MARRPAASTVRRYLKTLAGLMGLADWDIAILEGEPDDGAWASIEVHREKSYAAIRVSAALFREPAAEQRQAMVHELIHIHLAPLDWSFEDLSEQVTTKARRVARATWEQRSERSADDQARWSASYLPLPPWGTPTAR